MVKRYKDIGRVGVKSSPGTRFALQAPQNVGAEQLAKTVQQTSQNIANTFFELSKQKAIEQAKKDEQSSTIKFADGVPTFEPMELGGTIYNTAYNDAAKITYANALENSVNDKITSVKDEYFNDPTLRNNTNNLRALIDQQITPMRGQVPQQFKNVFDAIVQDKVQPLLQTDIKENANRARNNLVANLASHQKSLIQRLYKIKKDAPEFEQVVSQLNNILLKQQQINPNLISDIDFDNLNNEVKAIAGWQSIREKLFNQNEQGELIYNADDVLKLKLAISNNQASVDLQGEIFNLESIHDSIESKTFIENELTKFQNDRNKNNLDYLDYQEKVSSELLNFSQAINELGINPSQQELENLRTATVNKINGHDLPTGSKSNKQSKIARNQILADVNRTVQREINNIKIADQKYIFTKLKANLMNSFGDLTEVANIIDTNKDVFANNSEILDLRNWVNDSSVQEKHTEFFSLLKGQSKGTIQDIRLLLNGEKPLDNSIYLGKYSGEELLKLYAPVRGMMNEALTAIEKTKINITADQEAANIIRSNIIAQSKGEVLTNSSHIFTVSTDKLTKFVTNNIFENNNVMTPVKRAKLELLLKAGYRPTVIGKYLKHAVQSQDSQIMINLGVPIIKMLKDQNIDPADLGIKDESYGIIKTLSEYQLDNEVQVSTIVSNINSLYIDGGEKLKAGKLLLAKVLDPKIDSKTAKDEELFPNIRDDLLLAVFRDKNVDQRTAMKAREAVEQSINQWLIHFGATGDSMYSTKSEAIKDVQAKIENLSKGDLPPGYEMDMARSTNRAEDDFMAGRNNMNIVPISSAYHNLVSKYKSFAKDFGMNVYEGNVLTHLNVAYQLKNMDVFVPLEEISPGDVHWDKSFKESLAQFLPNAVFKIGTEIDPTKPLNLKLTERNQEFKRDQYKFEGIQGDIIGNSVNGNFVDLFTLESNPDDRGNTAQVPMLFGKNVKFVKNAAMNLGDNQRNIMISVDDGIGEPYTTFVMDKKTNRPAVITIPNDYKGLLEVYNSDKLNAERITRAKDKIITGEFNELAGQIGTNKPISQTISVDLYKNIFDVPQDLNTQEAGILNYYRSRYLYNIDVDKVDFKDSHIVSKNNKFYLMPSKELYFNTESQLYQFRDISATEAFEIFESSPYISEYETLDKAYIAKGKIEQIRKTDKNRFDSENR